MIAPSSGERPRVAIVVTAKVTASSFVSDFAKYVASHGYEVTILASGVDRMSQEIGSGTFAQIPVTMVRDPNPLSDLRSLISLTWQLQKLKPCVLTYATPKASLLSSMAGFMLRVPVRVYQLWGLRLETVSGFKRTVLAILEQLTSLLSTKVLANSHSLANKYRDLSLDAGREIQTLGEGSSHGVDIDYFSRDAKCPALDEATGAYLEKSCFELVVGFVGRLHPDKGIDTLLEAVRMVRTEGVSIGVILVGGDEGVALDLSDGLRECTAVVGSVDDPRPYYSAIDLLILPSLREGFPNVVLEAAAMSVPSIVSDGTGVVDSVVDNVTGTIVPVGDASALALAIRSFADDKKLRSRMGAAARRRVEESFDQKHVWDRTLAYLFEHPAR